MRTGMDVRMRWALKYSEGSPSMREIHRRIQNAGFTGSYSTVHRYFAGHSEPRPSVLIQIAAAIGCRPEWLLTGRSFHGIDHQVPLRRVERYLRLALQHTVGFLKEGSE